MFAQVLATELLKLRRSKVTWFSLIALSLGPLGIGGMLMLAFIVAFVFGREYADGTAKNLLALPVGRMWFVLAKLVVAAVWWFALVVVVLVEALAIGRVVGLPGFSPGLALG